MSDLLHFVESQELRKGWLTRPECSQGRSSSRTLRTPFPSRAARLLRVGGRQASREVGEGQRPLRGRTDSSCSPAVRYARLQEWGNFFTFSSKAKTLVLRRTPTTLYLLGMCRYLEGQVLYLQNQIEELSENAQDSGVEIFKVRPPGVSVSPSPSCPRPCRTLARARWQDA